ncbi:MAG: AbrB/MazE/SpoVT family DNA-binding domain-containing protein [Pseudomonadota bacterium]
MKTTVSSKGQIVLPAELRREDRIEPGQVLEIERIGPGEYRMTRVAMEPNTGVVAWLRACPDDDYFEPIESESTDTL